MIFCADGVEEARQAIQPEGGGSIPTPALHNLHWVECQSPAETAIFRETINRFHSYMEYRDTCNRRINWNVYYNGEPIAALGVNSALLALACRDNWVGWDSQTRRAKLNSVANNYRFAVRLKGVPNLGSRLLRGLRFNAAKAWKRKYGDELLLIETLVKPPWEGKVYKADNWQCVGMTKGYSFSKAPVKLWQKEHSERGRLARENPKAAIEKYAVGRKHYAVSRSEPKAVFMFPVVSNFRDVLCR